MREHCPKLPFMRMNGHLTSINTPLPPGLSLFDTAIFLPSSGSAYLSNHGSILVSDIVGRVLYKPALFDQRIMQGKYAPEKLKICRFVHLAHLGSRVQKRANFQAVRWNLVCRDVFGTLVRAFGRENGHSLQAWLNAGVQFWHWGHSVAKCRVAGRYVLPALRWAGLPLPPVRQHAYSQRRRKQTGWGGTYEVSEPVQPSSTRSGSDATFPAERYCTAVLGGTMRVIRAGA